jgi:hypothetical protein
MKTGSGAARVSASDSATAQAVCLPWVSGHRCLHACWREMVMGPIFDCRETATGPCPWRRTACESVGKRWCDVAGGLLTLGFRSHRCLHACWRGMVMGPIFDCRETVMGPCPWRRTACESGAKRWCDGAGGLLTLGFRLHRCLHACWRGSDVTRFSTVERPRWGRATLISKR